MLIDKSEKQIKRNTGLSSSQFTDLYSSLPSLREKFRDDRSASTALYIYLMKMRTALPSEDIACMFHLTQTTVDRQIKKVRIALENDFLYQNVNFVPSHEELSGYTTTMCRELFCENGQTILVCDGTYLFTNKSRNYEFQRDTYTDQKKRNFLKVMMMVASNGKIIYALEPYSARDNDAKILQMIAESTDVFENARANDILLLDRGFRDCIPFFQNKGFDVKMPSLLQNSNNKTQLSTEEANRTRLVTATRFIVETRNGHLKTIFKIFDRDKNPLAIPFVMTDFQICCGLINKYYQTFESNGDNAVIIANKMKSRLNMENFLAKIVNGSAFQRIMKKFVLFDDFDGLPTLTEKDLIMISLGKYQIKQAASYTQEHLKENENKFSIFILPDDISKDFVVPFSSNGKSPAILLIQFNSRYRSRKYYNGFVLIDRNGKGEYVVLGYYCDCYVGLRTVDCCSHVMTIIWFVLYKKNRNVPKPAQFLNDFFWNQNS